MRTLIVVVNYRTPELTVDCLASLAAQEVEGGYRVTVVDSASGDASAEKIEAAIAAAGFGSWASVLALPQNGGYGHAINAAARAALDSADPPRYVFVLNSDTVVRPGAVARLCEFLDDHPSAGIAGSRLEGQDGHCQNSVFRFHSILNQLDDGLRLGLVSRLVGSRRTVIPPPETPCRADWVSGAAMMIRASVLRDVDYFDEGYFLYFEETDLCRRARRAGVECWYVPESRIVHHVAQSTGIEGVERRRPAYWFESRRRYFRTHHGILYRFVCDLVYAAALSAGALQRWILRRPRVDPPYFLWDHVRHSFLPAALRRRPEVAG